MTNEELLALIKQAQGPGEVVTKIDTAIPLPIGSKTLIGFLGALLSGAVATVSANPQIIEGNWKTSLASILVVVFTALMGAGGIAKWQRQVNAASAAVDVLKQVLDTMKAREE